MKRILKSPGFNAVCISLFSAFYAVTFMLNYGNTDFEWFSKYTGESVFWSAWRDFLVGGHHITMAWVLVIVTAIVVALLLSRRRPHDEYHSTILANCLVVASITTLIAIGGFFLIVLSEPIWIAGKFALFIFVHWVTVVFANLSYILLCRWR